MGSTDRRGDIVRSSRRLLAPPSIMAVVTVLTGTVLGFSAVATHEDARRRLPPSVASGAPTPSVASKARPAAPLGWTEDGALNAAPLPASHAPNADDLPLATKSGVAGVPTAQPVVPLAALPADPIGLYSFEVTNPDGSPARWNRCAPVHYIVNLTGAPLGASDDLHRAITVVGKATGLRFVDDGTTTAALNTSWITSGPVGADGWPDVIIGWSSPGRTDLKLTAGMGGITEYEAASLPGGGSGLVGAVVVLSGPNDPGAGFSPNARGALLLHELAHAVGLGHVDDKTQLMNPVSTAAAGSYGTGDLAGLKILGTGACFVVPTRAQTDVGPAVSAPPTQ